MNLISIDPGLSGGITLSTPTSITTIRMSIRVVIDKPPVYIFARDSSNNKITIKSGPNAGQFKRKIRTPAKSHRELDCHAIYQLFQQADTFIIETPGNSRGNSSRSTASTNRNYGKLLAIAEICNLTIHTVTPSKWKSDLDLGRDKSVAISFAEQLLRTSSLPSNQSTFSSTEDGLAESVIIAYHFNKESICPTTKS